ncbi:DEAD/DEAH box helicase [Enterovirga sp.]|uniref:DEAD/DEAH box helicase n=1 Tax=Enterovirga sp. TaxID=2026350 RepID=UPI002D141BB7|nr:DEAD/DEAH box helicase [Enterovirga sp.]HMO28661.1 DEAD/DEAH box helicase [Enterovirga sp.]
MTDFQQFHLAAPILRALAEEGYESPTPIQLQAIPSVMAGRDLQGIAQTGTGKTAAFALPILHRLAKEPVRPRPKGTRVLVLSPTRELASQIADSFRAYGRHLRLSTTVVFGGVPIGRQQRALAGGVDILVATPGRLLDLVDQRSLTLQDVEILVLDEADQMLDLGFIHALRRIVTLVPRKRQTLFFSATMPKSIEQLSAQFIADPVKVAVTPVATTAERVEQSVLFVAQPDKPALLRAVIEDRDIDRVLVFTRTKHGADKVVAQLARSGIEAAAIHGNKSQGQRERALADFKAGRNRVLVATDIAARGIDVDGVSHVVNFDLPNVPESYVHRIGRTARAGADGQAVSFCNQEERAYLRDIEKLTRLAVPVADYPPGFAPAQREPAVAAEPASHRRGARPEGQRQGRRPGGPNPGRGPASASRDAHRPGEQGASHRGQPSEGRRPKPQKPVPGWEPAPGRDRNAARGEGGGGIAWLQRGPSRGR